jgi:hypothetical protein
LLATEPIFAIERNDPGTFALFTPRPRILFRPRHRDAATNCPETCGIERKIGGQCDCSISIFESIQIKTILNYEFEIVLKLYLKRSKSSQGKRP